MAREFGNWRRTEQPAVKTTIVGGRPPGPGKPLGNVPHGIEVLLIEASVDPRFRRLLLEKRAEAAKSIGVIVTPAEAQLLNGVPADQLAQVIAETRVSKKLRAARRRRVVKVAVAALGAAGLGYGCREYAKHLERLEAERIALLAPTYAISGIIVSAGFPPGDPPGDELEVCRSAESELPGRGEREGRELGNGKQ